MPPLQITAELFEYPRVFVLVRIRPVALSVATAREGAERIVTVIDGVLKAGGGDRLVACRAVMCARNGDSGVDVGRQVPDIIRGNAFENAIRTTVDSVVVPNVFGFQTIRVDRETSGDVGVVVLDGFGGGNLGPIPGVGGHREDGVVNFVLRLEVLAQRRLSAESVCRASASAPSQTPCSLDERVFALIALVGPRAGMDAPVAGERARVGESFVALVAFVRALAGASMRPSVPRPC